MRNTWTRLALLIVCICLVLGAAFAGPKDAYRPGEVLVKFKPGISAMGAAASIGATVRTSVAHINVHCLKLPSGQSVDDAVRKLSKNPNVVWAEPNHIIRISSTFPDDPYFQGEEMCFPELDLCLPTGGQWGLYNEEGGRHDIHAPEAWDIEQGSENTIIAIIDTGIQSYHWDLDGRVIDGYNALDGSTNTDDDHMHGTFVASVAAANSNNAEGVAGVDWNARLMPVKVLDASGEGDEAGAAVGIVWAVDHGAKIINMSFGTYLEVQALEDAVNYAWNAGCVVVAASGNDGADDAVDRHYPSYYPVCISVGATNEYDQRCTAMDWLEGGSNYGDSLDVMAPGNNIYGAVPGSYDPFFGEWTEYESMSGTSAAAPFVSGLAGLIWAHNPSWTNEQVRAQIERTCDDIGATGKDRYTGWGRVNAYRALSEAPTSYSTIGETISQPDGEYVDLPAKVVTAGVGNFTDRFYIEETDRSAGLMVYCGSNSGITAAIGDKVKVRGKLSTVDGERALITPEVVPTGTDSLPRVLGMPARSVAGNLPLYGGETPSTGLRNVGLLIKTWGWVRSTGWNYVYIDDGSSLRDGSGWQGLKVYTKGLTKPSVGQFVSITGICSVEQPPDTELQVPVLRARVQSDIVRLN